MALPAARPCVEYDPGHGAYELVRYGDSLVDKLLAAGRRGSGPFDDDFVSGVGLVYDAVEGSLRLTVGEPDATRGPVYPGLVLAHPHVANPPQGGCPLRQRLAAHEGPGEAEGYGHGVGRKLMKAACSSLVFDETGEKVLLTRRAAGMRHFPNAWVFPGGHIDHPTDASLEDACLRELLEECGIRIEPAFGSGPHGKQRVMTEQEKGMVKDMSQEWGIEESPPPVASRRRSSAVTTPINPPLNISPKKSHGDAEIRRNLSEVWGLELDARGEVVPDADAPRPLRKRLASTNSFARKSSAVSSQKKTSRRKSELEKAIDRELIEEWGVDTRDDDVDAPPPRAEDHPDYAHEKVDTEQLHTLSETWGNEIAQGMVNPIPEACQAQAAADFGCDIAQGMVAPPIVTHKGTYRHRPHTASPDYLYIHPTDPSVRSRVTVQPFFLWESASPVRDEAEPGVLPLPGSHVLIVYFKVTLHDVPADAVPLTLQAEEVSASAWVDAGLLLDRRKYSALPADEADSVGTPSPVVVSGFEAERDGDGWRIDPAAFSIQQLLPPYDNDTEEEGMPRAPEIALQAAFQPEI
eukprot:TRINITY_DN15722_c0_g1_i1.p1 TRINITY_DN15722_c0_g1~~TRINITY_DN15722_c0_g1_i1.p1  ORF type:complete len:595 (+),score=190.34 TRINITY_DN15722_c0_g1_i1:53-1786(+)